MLETLLREAAWQSKLVRWRIESIARGGLRTGMPFALRWPGVRVLARELPKGANPSLMFRFLAANDPHRIGLLEPRSLIDPTQADRVLSFYELDATLDRLAAALVARGIKKGVGALI